MSVDDGGDIPRTGLESLMPSNSSRAGECRAGSTRLAGWSGERAIVCGKRRVGHGGLRSRCYKGDPGEQRAESEDDTKGRV